MALLLYGAATDRELWHDIGAEIRAWFEVVVPGVLMAIGLVILVIGSIYILIRAL